jgi:hypothetical protein
MVRECTRSCQKNKHLPHKVRPDEIIGQSWRILSRGEVQVLDVGELQETSGSAERFWTSCESDISDRLYAAMLLEIQLKSGSL